MKIVSENQFSGKTFFIQLPPGFFRQIGKGIKKLGKGIKKVVTAPVRLVRKITKTINKIGKIMRRSTGVMRKVRYYWALFKAMRSYLGRYQKAPNRLLSVKAHASNTVGQYEEEL